jgi:tetratricopeptide (TPR) repeat protein
MKDNMNKNEMMNRKSAHAAVSHRGSAAGAPRWLRGVFGAVALLAGAVWLAACGAKEQRAPQEELALEVRALEERLAEGLDKLEIDTAVAVSFVEKAQLFAERFAQDSLAPHFLFRAGDVARGLGDYDLALQLWDKVAREYEGSPRAPQALFFRAFTLDNDLRRPTAARQAYEAFLARYPEHPMAKDALALMQVLESGKTPEELIREFQAQAPAEE